MVAFELCLGASTRTSPPLISQISCPTQPSWQSRCQPPDGVFKCGSHSEKFSGDRFYIVWQGKSRFKISVSLYNTTYDMIISRKRDHWISAEVLIYQYFNWLGGVHFWVISVACQLGIDQNWPRGGSRQGGPPPPFIDFDQSFDPPSPPLALTAFRIDQMDWGGGGAP